MWKNNMQIIANIGAMTRPQFRNMPTLDLAGAIDDYYNSKDAAVARVDAEAEKQRRQAMVDEMTAQHPEAAAQIAADPMGYAKMLEERAKAERDQQFKMDMLNRQFSNSLALADRQNANSIGLAKMRNELQNQAAANAKEQRAAELEEALNSGMITKEQYNLAKQRDLLGDIVNGGKSGGGAFDSKNEFISLLGIKNTPAIWDALPEEDKKSIQARLNYMSNNPNNIYETSYQRAAGSAAAGLEYKPQLKIAEETAKNMAAQNKEYSEFEANMPSLEAMTDELIDLADKATYTQVGQLRDALLRQADMPMSEGGIAREKYRQVVRNELIPQLKRTFGGQLSDSERTELLGTLGNENLSPEEKKAAVKSFIESKRRQMKYYQRMKAASNNTLPNNNLQVGQTIGGFKIVGVE